MKALQLREFIWFGQSCSVNQLGLVCFKWSKERWFKREKKKITSWEYIQGIDLTASNTAWGLGPSYSFFLCLSTPFPTTHHPASLSLSPFLSHLLFHLLLQFPSIFRVRGATKWWPAALALQSDLKPSKMRKSPSVQLFKKVWSLILPTPNCLITIPKALCLKQCPITPRAQDSSPSPPQSTACDLGVREAGFAQRKLGCHYQKKKNWMAGRWKS